MQPKEILEYVEMKAMYDSSEEDATRAPPAHANQDDQKLLYNSSGHEDNGSDDEYHQPGAKKHEPERSQPTRFAKVVVGSGLEPRVGRKFQVDVVPLLRWVPAPTDGDGHGQNEPVLVTTQQIAAELVERAELRAAGHTFEQSSQERDEYVDARYLSMGAARALSPTGLSPAQGSSSAATTSGGGVGGSHSSANRPLTKPKRRRRQTPAIGFFACALPDVYNVRARPASLPPWPSAEATKGRRRLFRREPMTKSMVMAQRGYPRVPPAPFVTRLQRDDETEEVAPPPPPPTSWRWPREGDRIEIEVEEKEGTLWRVATVVAVLIDGWFSARMDHDDEWVDWFTWKEEGVDWRRSSSDAKRKPSEGVRTDTRKEPGKKNGKERDIGGMPAMGERAGGSARPPPTKRVRQDDGGGIGSVPEDFVARVARDGKKLPRDLAALVDVNKPGPAWTASFSPNQVAATKNEDRQTDVEAEVEAEVKPVPTKEEKQAEEEARAKAEMLAERAALAAARQRVSIPVLSAELQQLASVAVEVGMGCDVEQHDEGLVGARFSAEVRQLWPLRKAGKKRPVTQVLVEYDTLFSEDEGGSGSASEPKRLQEWVEISSLHPVPSLPSDGWITHVRPGDRLDGLYQGGWWTVVVVEQCHDAPTRTTHDGRVATVAQPDGAETSASTSFVTDVVGYDDLQRTFCAADLRPPLDSPLLRLP